MSKKCIILNISFNVSEAEMHKSYYRETEIKMIMFPREHDEYLMHSWWENVFKGTGINRKWNSLNEGSLKSTLNPLN